MMSTARTVFASPPAMSTQQAQIMVATVIFFLVSSLVKFAAYG
jgi:hypothetical protein